MEREYYLKIAAELLEYMEIYGTNIKPDEDQMAEVEGTYRVGEIADVLEKAMR